MSSQLPQAHRHLSVGLLGHMVPSERGRSSQPEPGTQMASMQSLAGGGHIEWSTGYLHEPAEQFSLVHRIPSSQSPSTRHWLQTPPRQMGVGAVHRFPQPPQLFGSVMTSTQLAPQQVCPTAHAMSHRPQ